MIKHYGKLALAHGLISALFIGILLFGETNMFTIPIALVFVVSTIYCTLQWHTSKLFAKIEAKNPKWK